MPKQPDPEPLDLAVAVDPDASPGNALPILARLLLELARRKQAAPPVEPADAAQ